MTLPSCSACVATAASSQRTTLTSSQALALCVEDSALRQHRTWCNARLHKHVHVARNMHLSHRHLSCPAGRMLWVRPFATICSCCSSKLRTVPCSTWRTALYSLAQHVHVALRALLRANIAMQTAVQTVECARVCGACRPADGVRVVRGRPAAHAPTPPRARFPHTPRRR